MSLKDEFVVFSTTRHRPNYHPSSEKLALFSADCWSWSWPIVERTVQRINSKRHEEDDKQGYTLAEVTAEVADAYTEHGFTWAITTRILDHARSVMVEDLDFFYKREPIFNRYMTQNPKFTLHSRIRAYAEMILWCEAVTFLRKKGYGARYKRG